MFIRRLVRSLVSRSFFSRSVSRQAPQPSQARREANQWLRAHCRDIQGEVLSIGSGDDSDGEGGVYRDYFTKASSYTTSEVSETSGCELTIDARSMPEIRDQAYGCVFCSGVLEHVDEYHKALCEITRILKNGGVLLLGLPFRQAIHLPPQDFWRFTEHGIRHMLKDSYEISELVPIDTTVENFPSAYWLKAKKICDPPSRMP